MHQAVNLCGIESLLRPYTLRTRKKTPQTKINEMQVGAIQHMALLFVFREHPCQVCKGTHASELTIVVQLIGPTFVNSVSREHTQLCNLRYVHVFICLY